MDFNHFFSTISLCLGLIGTVAGLLAHGKATSNAGKIAQAAESAQSQLNNLQNVAAHHDGQLTSLAQSVGEAVATAKSLAIDLKSGNAPAGLTPNILESK